MKSGAGRVWLCARCRNPSGSLGARLRSRTRDRHRGSPSSCTTGNRGPRYAQLCEDCLLGPYGAAGLDFTEGMSDGFREEIRVFLDDPGRARAEFQARSAEFARLTSSAAWWMDRWADRAGKDAAHIPHATAHFPAMRTTPTSRRTTAAQPSPGCAATYDWQARHQELKMKPMTTPMGGRAIGSERPRLYSFGHSNVALEDFLCLLKSCRIEVVADVRSSPRSRYVPHFDAPRLQGALAQQEIKYVSQRRRSVEMPPSPPHRASAARPRSRGASHQRRRPHPGRR